MPNRQSTSGLHRHAPSPRLRANLGCLFLLHPALAQSAPPLSLDDTLVSLIIVLCLVGGLGIGILYRSMCRREEALTHRMSAAEAELQTLLTMTDDAILLLDEKAVVRNANPAAEEIFGCLTNEITGTSLAELLPQPTPLTELTKNGPAQFQTTANRKGGTTTQVEVFLSQVHLAGPISYLALIQENHDAILGRTEEKPRSLGEPVNQFCHDLNNQLTGIIGNLSLILMTSSPEPITRERILGAKKTAHQAQELSRQMQLLAQSEAGFDETANAAGPIIPLPIPAPTPAEEQPRRVLVLDDEEAICTLVSTVLDSMGFKVTEATDVLAAIRACEEAIKTGRPFDLVISDLSLDGEMSGSDAVARLKTIDPNLKAIVSSGYDNDPIMSHYREHGFCAAISKPYEISRLSKVVCEAIGSDEQRKTA